MSQFNPANRPLSPHLQIYKPILSMMMSILHRITGAALFFGAILLVWWLFAAALSDSAYGLAQTLLGSWPGLLVLFGFSWALIHHMLGGIRHLIWDTGRGFKLTEVDFLVTANIVGSVLLTLALWAIGYGVLA